MFLNQHCHKFTSTLPLSIALALSVVGCDNSTKTSGSEPPRVDNSDASYEDDGSDDSYAESEADVVNDLLYSAEPEGDPDVVDENVEIWEEPLEEVESPVFIDTKTDPEAPPEPTPEPTLDVPSDSDDEEPQIVPESNPDAGQLTAGEWSDLTNWRFWRELVNPEDGAWAEMEDKWSIYTHLRYPVYVTAGDTPVADATVHLINDTTSTTIWTARTDNLGRAELFSGAFGEIDDMGDVSIEVTQGTNTVTLDAPEANPLTAHAVDLQDEVTEPAFALDLMFVVDTTGSMGDELDYLKAELADVITTVKTTYGENLDIRLSVNFYRDHKDLYLIRPFPFTDDIDSAILNLQAQTANGGGDYPEAMQEALENAIDEHEWSESARARLLFLVADAPPHNDPQFNGILHRIVKDAAAEGIRFFPVAASGVDKDTEFLMRMLDIATGGSYLFLTDDSGVGGDHAEPTVGQHDIYYFNDLLVYVIERALQ